MNGKTRRKKMLITGLPYDNVEMERIRNNGAIVDFNNICFPGIEDDRQIEVAFIYLRNTGFNIVPDLSACPFETKVKILKTYIETNMECTNQHFADTWIAILLNSLGLVYSQETLLTSEEIERFVDENVEYVGRILTFLNSLVVYAISRFEHNNTKIVMDGFPCTDEELVGVNIHKIIQHKHFYIIDTQEIDVPKLNFTKYFTMENNELFDSMKDLPYMAILIGLVEHPQEKWDEILNNEDTE